MDVQKMKARELADRGRCALNTDGSWTVISLTTTNTKYRVRLNSSDGNKSLPQHSCSCPHFEIIQENCKHIRAVLSVISQDNFDRANGREPRERIAEGEAIRYPRRTYPQPDWAKYNLGQTTERDHVQRLLADLCATIPQPPRKPGKGRNAIPLATAIFCAVYKVYLGISARRGTCDLEECHRRGHITSAPHFNSVLKALDDEATTPILYELIRVSALPLSAVETKFGPDSTGFCTNTYTRWMDVKYGTLKQEVKWVKLHASVGTFTNVIAAAIILEKDTGDSPQLPHLMQETAKGFTVEECSADKAYSSLENFEAVDALGGQLYSAFKVNTTGGVGGLFEKAYLMFRLNKDDYLKHYHQRSNVESTFSALKRKLGEAVKSKTEVAQKNEVLAKVLAYNLTVLVAAYHELGIAAEFAPAVCTLNEEPAHILRFPTN
jgi:transposase